MTSSTLILGTRGSELALFQADMATAALQAAHPGLKVERRIIQTSGDKRQDLRFSEFAGVAQVDKGIFIKELESALAKGEIHAAVHSLKDVPSELAEGFQIAAVMPRAPIEDVLVTAQPCAKLADLPKGARVGTSSVRRAAQIKWLRPDLQVVEIRGNVPTRVRKVSGESALDAVLLAAAGLKRLGLLKDNGRLELGTEVFYGLTLPKHEFLPAAGQGAVALECRAGDASTQHLLRSINHGPTEVSVTAEREFLRLLGAGCQTPVGVHTWFVADQLYMAVRLFNEANLSSPPKEFQGHCLSATPLDLARQMAQPFSS